MARADQRGQLQDSLRNLQVKKDGDRVTGERPLSRLTCGNNMKESHLFCQILEIIWVIFKTS